MFFLLSEWKGAVYTMFQNGACYIRVSTDDQTEYSPDAQLKAIKRYAKQNNILLVKDNIYIDEGISGRKAEKRPAFMKMIAVAKTKPKPFDVILVHKFDRFARSREDSVVYKSLLKKENNIKVISITESIEDDKFSVILEAMLEAMAEYYSLNLSDEVKKGMTEKAERGGYQSCPPLGYRMENKKLVIIPEEAELVKLIYDQYVNHQKGVITIAKMLNEMGYKTKRNCLFEYRTVQYILKNPVYIGKARWTPTGTLKRNENNPNTIIRDSEHEAIISNELWDKAQETYQKNKRLHKPREKSTAKLVTWLKGIVKCGNCNKTLVLQGNGYMQCNAYNKGTCTVSCWVSIEKIENLVLEELKKTFTEKLEININYQDDGTNSFNMYQSLQEKLHKLEVKEKRIKTAYQDGIDTLEEYKENKLKLLEQKQKLNELLQKAENEVVDKEKNIKSHIYKQIQSVYELLTNDSIDIETKSKTVRFLIDSITYDKKNATLKIQYK